MIKKISILLFIMIVLTQTIGISAANVTVRKYDPILDGVISPDEWPEEGKFLLNKAVTDSYQGCWSGEMSTAQQVTYYFLWCDDGLYVAADIKDSTKVIPTTWDSHGADGGPAADAFQLNLFAHDLARWFTIGTMADGKLSARTHYGDISDLTDIMKGKGTVTSDGYVIESFIPWEIVQAESDIKEGLSIPILFTYMDRYDGGEICYKTMEASIWPPNEVIDIFLVLGSEYAPPIPEEVAADVPADAADTSKPATTVTSSAPQTNDAGIAIAVLLIAAASLSGVVLKKRSVK